MLRLRVGALVVLTAAALLGWQSMSARDDERSKGWSVVEVLDGDTIGVIRDGVRETVRLLGVDTPETRHPDRPVECFGPEASAFTTERLLGRTVELETDVERRDVYDRLLAYVWAAGARFNDELVRSGHARLLVISPNDRHGRALLRAELDARAAGRGLWGACE